MSTALAIAGVTAVLRHRLNEGLLDHNIIGMLGSAVSVSVLTPDRLAEKSSEECSRLNLFLYQVTPNTAWRNAQLPARDDFSMQHRSNPPLALDLHYLISVCSSTDLHAEILIGCAMQLLHASPVLTREWIHSALNPSPDSGIELPPAVRALAQCGLADQMESLRISPRYLNTEEMSKLWTATQSSYGLSVAYQVSVVLIEATQPDMTPDPT